MVQGALERVSYRRYMYCIGAVLTVLTGGSFLAALGIGFKAAAMAGFISGGISVMSSLIVSIFSGDSFKTILEKVLRSFVDGFASGFMWGGIRYVRYTL